MRLNQMNNSAIFDWIKYTFLDVIDDQNIIMENQNGATPSDDYITFGIIACVGDDYPIETKEPLDNEHCTKTIHNRYNVTVSVNIFSNDAYSYLNRLKISPKLDTVKPVFKENDMSLLGCTGFKNLTFLGDTTFKPRYQSDFSFYMIATDEEIIDLIKAYYLGYSENDDPFNKYIDIGEGLSLRQEQQLIRVDRFA